jgi:hypothetical protein
LNVAVAQRSIGDGQSGLSKGAPLMKLPLKVWSLSPPPAIAIAVTDVAPPAATSIDATASLLLGAVLNITAPRCWFVWSASRNRCSA